MKIISKFKDFYDYKVAKYGVDEKLVYTRKTYCVYFQVWIGNISNINIDYRISEDDFNKNLKDDINPIDEKNIHKILFIGEKLIHLFSTENGVYTHFNIKNENDLRKLNDFQYKKEITFKDGEKFNIYSRFRSDWDYLLSYNRKKEELDKIFLSDNILDGIELLKKYGLDKELNLYDLDKIKSRYDLLGIWSIVDKNNLYPFNKNEFNIIKGVREIIDKKIDNNILYK